MMKYIFSIDVVIDIDIKVIELFKRIKATKGVGITKAKRKNVFHHYPLFHSL